LGKRNIPIYPEPEDLVFLIDALVDVAGSYSRGILFRFGERVGEKYALRIKDLEGEVDLLSGVLGTLRASSWFDSVEIRRENGTLEIRLLNPFEIKSSEKSCDFMRGFLSGLGKVLEDIPDFFVEEKEDCDEEDMEGKGGGKRGERWVVFRGKTERR